MVAVAVSPAGQITVGGILSTTVTLCAAVLVLPDASVTVQVTTVIPTGKLAGALFVAVSPGQLSEVTGVPNTTPVAAQLFASTFTLTADGAVITGFSLSSTVILNEQVAVPQILVAVTVTVVTPLLNTEPLPLPALAPVVAPLQL